MVKQHNYLIQVRTPIGKLMPSVQELQDSINKFMSPMTNEEIVITSVIDLNLTSSKRLTPKDKTAISDIVKREFSEKFGSAVVESFKMQ